MTSDWEKIRQLFEPYIPKEQSASGGYVVAYACRNCLKRSNIRFPRGTLAPDEGIRCTNCGTRQTTKVA